MHWSDQQGVAWKTAIPGLGWSSPIVWGEQIFLTSATKDGRSCHVLAIARRDGKMLWDVEVFQQTPARKEEKNSYATPTPVTDGRLVYAAFPGGIAAVDLNGNIVWTNRDDPFYSRHGLGASPILYEDLLIMPLDGSVRIEGPGAVPPSEETSGWQKPWDKGFVLALDKATGKRRWKSSRQLMTRISHVTPLVINVQGQEQLISPAGDFVEAFAPGTGQPIWWVHSAGETPVPSVVFGHGLLFTTSGFEKETIRAIRPGGLGETGDLTSSHIQWESQKAVPMVPSFIYVESPRPMLFSVKESGIAQCRDATNGTTLWQKRLDGTYSASPIVAAGKIYFLNEAGKTTIIDAAPEFHIAAENELNGAFQASPALSDGQLLLRSDRALCCIRNGQDSFGH